MGVLIQYLNELKEICFHPCNETNTPGVYTAIMPVRHFLIDACNYVASDKFGYYVEIQNMTEIEAIVRTNPAPLDRALLVRKSYYSEPDRVIYLGNPPPPPVPEPEPEENGGT